MKPENQNSNTERSPVVAIMGHIDHGKSTLLSYIRKNTKDLVEAGGITQHISSYEVEHLAKDGKKHLITFLDTPGHSAFSGIRKRGASVADIGILVVSAEDGVKPQTLEAQKSIVESGTPYIVVINKIDKPEANIEKTKQSLTENEIYIEGYGGDIPAVALSAKTGEGVSELLDMIILVAELENLTGDKTLPAEGVIIESTRDIQKGISAVCIIKNGSLEKGEFVATNESIAPIRIIENYLGKPVDSATFSSPIKIIGWDKLPEVGSTFQTFKTKNEAVKYIEKENKKPINNKQTNISENNLNLVVKADTGSSLEAVLSEISKLESERMGVQIISSGIGAICENDIRVANGSKKAIVLGFNTKIDSPAKDLSERNAVEVKTFDVIYKLTEWLSEKLIEKTPKMQVDEAKGKAKILKIFSKVKDKQILGGRVEDGSITLGSQVKIMRREAEIGQGKIRELQSQKVSISEASLGKEFGALIEAKIEIAPGDHIECFVTVEK